MRLTTPAPAAASRWAWLWEPRGVLALLLGWAAFHVLLRLALSPTLTADDAREAVLAQSLQWGYQARQPPLYNWLAWAAFRVLGPGLLALTLLKYAHARPRLLARVPDGAAGPGRPETRRAERFLVPPDRSDQLDDPRGADPQHHRPRRLRRDGLRADPPRRFARPARLRAPRSRRRARAPLEVHVRHLPRRARPRCVLRRPLPRSASCAPGSWSPRWSRRSWSSRTRSGS